MVPASGKFAEAGPSGMWSLPPENLQRPKPQAEQGFFDWLKSKAVDVTEIGLGGLQVGGEFMAGIGDTVSMGATGWARRWYGGEYGDIENPYVYGTAAGVTTAVETAGAVGLAKKFGKKILTEGVQGAVKGIKNWWKGAPKTVPVKGAPKQTPKFQPPTNPPSLPPTEIPAGYNVRVMPPTAQYPNGYWKLEKPMSNGGWQAIDPSTMKPGTRPQTHIPLPPKK